MTASRPRSIAAAYAFSVAALLASVLLPRPSLADWPQFLGPARNGESSEKGLMKAWPKGGPPVVWRSPGGVGMSAVVVVGKSAWTMVQDSRSQKLVCLDAQTGKQRWATAIAPAYRNQQGNGPRATPAVSSGGAVVVFTGEGILAAVNGSSGDLIWKENVLQSLGGKVADFGMACSPLIHKDRVFVTVGAPGGSTCAFALRDGKLLWKQGDDPAGYSSPALLEIAGSQQLVVFNGAALLGIRPGDGSQLWRYPYVTDFDCNIATPIQVGRNVFISAGENHGCALLQFKSAGKQIQVGEVWKSQGPRSVMRNAWQTSIVKDGMLYGFDNVGAAGPVMHFSCIDVKTGKAVWRKTRFGKGNLIAADGKLFITTMKGELVVLKIDPSRYVELGRKELLGMTRQHAALASGRLYLRDDREIICVDVRAQAD